MSVQEAIIALESTNLLFEDGIPEKLDSDNLAEWVNYRAALKTYIYENSSGDLPIEPDECIWKS